MRIINSNKNFIIAEDGPNGVVVHDENFKREWQITGIVIPHLLQKEYENQSVIKLEDKNFRKALFEVYYPFCMNHTIFKLEAPNDSSVEK